MEYYLYPTYGLLVSTLGLLEILVSIKLDEEGLPRADPFWLTARALFLAFAAGTMPLAIIYGLISGRMVMHFILLLVTTFVVFSSYIVLQKSYLIYPSLILVIVSIVLAPFIGFLGFIIATAIWVILVLILYLTKVNLPTTQAVILDLSKKAVDWKMCLIVLIADVIVGFLRLHGIAI